MLSIRRPRVLCIDNDRDFRELLRVLLRLSLIEPTTVGTAAQALSSIQTDRFDMYLMDAWLPEIDGFELCRRIRHLDSHTPILFFSGAAYEADKTRGIEAGADAYVIKPDLDSLLESIRQFFPFAEIPTAQRELKIPRLSPWEMPDSLYVG